MKASELRIGNLIWDRHGRHVTVVDTISAHPENKDLFLVSTASAYPPKILDLHEPILLTEEWLLKFGFTKYDKERYGGNNLYQIFKNDDGYWLDDYEFGTINNNPILYVHQLQNLYFALTGEELCYTKQQ